MKNKDIHKTFTVTSTDMSGDLTQATAPRGYVQASDHAKRLLESGHTNVQITIRYNIGVETTLPETNGRKFDHIAPNGEPV